MDPAIYFQKIKRVFLRFRNYFVGFIYFLWKKIAKSRNNIVANTYGHNIIISHEEKHSIFVPSVPGYYDLKLYHLSEYNYQDESIEVDGIIPFNRDKLPISIFHLNSRTIFVPVSARHFQLTGLTIYLKMTGHDRHVIFHFPADKIVNLQDLIKILEIKLSEKIILAESYD
jgi:hypothetical protein